jgi:hypothetical protein
MFLIRCRTGLAGQGLHGAGWDCQGGGGGGQGRIVDMRGEGATLMIRSQHVLLPFLKPMCTFNKTA